MKENRTTIALLEHKKWWINIHFHAQVQLYTPSTKTWCKSEMWPKIRAPVTEEAWPGWLWLPSQWLASSKHSLKHGFSVGKKDVWGLVYWWLIIPPFLQPFGGVIGRMAAMHFGWHSFLGSIPNVEWFDWFLVFMEYQCHFLLGLWADALHGSMRLTIFNFMCIDIDSLSECHRN